MKTRRIMFIKKKTLETELKDHLKKSTEVIENVSPENVSSVIADITRETEEILLRHKDTEKPVEDNNVKNTSNRKPKLSLSVLMPSIAKPYEADNMIPEITKRNTGKVNVQILRSRGCGKNTIAKQFNQRRRA